MLTLMRQGVVDALRDHRSQGRSIIVWDRANQRVVEVPPGEIVIPEDENNGDHD